MEATEQIRENGSQRPGPGAGIHGGRGGAAADGRRKAPGHERGRLQARGRGAYATWTHWKIYTCRSAVGPRVAPDRSLRPFRGLTRTGDIDDLQEIVDV